MANAARYEMVAGNPDEAIRLADRAIALAEEFVDASRQRVGIGQPSNGDGEHGRLRDPRSTTSGRRSSLTRENPFELTRAHVNLGSVLLDLGEIEEAIEVEREAVVGCERMGTIDGFGRFVLGNLAEALFLAGQWDEAETLVADGREHAERTGGQYHEPLFEFVVGELGLVRDGRASDAADSAPPRGRPRP